MENIKNFPGTEEMLEIIKKCSFDGMFIAARDGTIVFLSDAYEKITGQKSSLLIGKNAADLKRMGVLETSVFERVQQTHRATTMMLTYNVSGKEALVTAVPIFTSDGEYYATLGNIRDLSDLNELKRDLERVHKRMQAAETELSQIRVKEDMDREFIARSPEMRSLVALAQRIALVDSTVLITGESGVGKDVYTKLIQRLARDGMKKPFVKISCGAIPESLLESELFGYMEGAFTGAKRGGKLGAFELAGDGIVFLDEIGEMPISLQVKLLTVLQDRQFLPVGGTKPIPMKARIVAATNKDLEAAIANGSFRRDLYYRLNVIPVEIPPLRARREDIVPLIDMVAQNLNKKYGTEKSFAPETLRYLERYNWPGNVRELVNVVERMMALCIGDVITPDQLPDTIHSSILQESMPVRNDMDLRSYLEQMERYRISMALNKPQTFAEAAQELGIDQSTLTRKVQKYKLQRRNVTRRVHEELSNITL